MGAPIVWAGRVEKGEKTPRERRKSEISDGRRGKKSEIVGCPGDWLSGGGAVRRIGAGGPARQGCTQTRARAKQITQPNTQHEHTARTHSTNTQHEHTARTHSTNTQHTHTQHTHTHPTHTHSTHTQHTHTHPAHTPNTHTQHTTHTTTNTSAIIWPKSVLAKVGGRRASCPNSPKPKRSEQAWRLHSSKSCGRCWGCL